MTVCPPRQALLSYEQGELAEEPPAGLEEHVRTCEACLKILRELRNTDPDTALLRRVFETTGTRTVDRSATAGKDGAGAVGDTQGSPRVADGSSSPITPSVPNVDELRVPAPILADPASGDWPIPDYERVMLCGEGSYGAVWAVRDRVGVYRAMKVIDRQRLAEAHVQCHEMAALETYCRKIDRHPHLITVYHVGVADRFLHYTMELADDRSLPGPVRDAFPRNYRPLTLDLVIRGGRLRPEASVEIARRLLRGLAKLHALDLLHRDIKPSNIIFVDRNPKLADIGILTSGARTSRAVGTPRYMPPDGVTDKTADVYALGKVLHEMLFGRHADPASTSGRYRDLDAFGWDMERVGRVVERACVPAAQDRYPSAAAMLEDLEACQQLRGSLLDELEIPNPPTRPAAWKILTQLAFAFIHRLPWIAAAVVALYALTKLGR